MVTAPGDRQAAIERRYRALSGSPIDRQRSPRELFGEFAEWVLRVGPHELVLNPMDGVWYHYDRASDSVRSAGHLAGEVTFFLDGSRLGTRPARQVPTDDVAPWRLTTAGGAEYMLKTETTIGRSEDCAVVLADDQASRRHAVIRRQGDGYVIEDLGSRNGTFVNGSRIDRPTPLRPGDVITIGSSRLSLRD